MTTQQVHQVSVAGIAPLGPEKTGIYRLTLDISTAPGFLQSWRPGQFVMVREPRPDTSLTWARPFCISHANGKTLTIFFQVVGRATREMARLQPGSVLDVWGPLGNSFVVDENAPTLLLAGGMGFAPLLGYALSHPCPENLSLEFGHRLPLECYPFKEFEKINATSHAENCLDDRECFMRLIDGRMEKLSPAPGAGPSKGLVLACGPSPFLKAVQTFALKHTVRTQISLETRMACGIGACLGCVVKASDKREGPLSFTQTCTSGPNFWADRVEI